jgi:hypothetical protein
MYLSASSTVVLGDTEKIPRLEVLMREPMLIMLSSIRG